MADISGDIVDIVANGQVQGGRLGHELRSRHPGWSAADVGARNLRDFIERFVPGVKVVGHAGLDVVYGPSNSEPGSSALADTAAVGDRPATGNMNLWRIWVSPNSPYAIAVDHETGRVTTMARDGSGNEQIAKLEPASQVMHREIAREFINGLDGSAASRLTTALDAPGDDWWQSWFSEIQSSGLSERWQRHRTSALDAGLKESIKLLQLTDLASELVYEAVCDDRLVRRVTAKSSLVPSAVHRSPPSDLLTIVAAVVQQMSLHDLRELKLPVGLVLDIVQRHKA